MSTQSRRVLVTGGAGFIGSWVVDAMVDAGHEVVALDNLSRGKKGNLNPRARFVEADLVTSDLGAILAEVRPEVISHHAAQASVPGSTADPVNDATLNVVASVRLLDAARQHGVQKIIYAASGGSTYGVPQYVPIDETHPIDPISPYAVSKHTVEHYLRTYHVLYGLAFTSLRYANVYGPRQDPHGEAGVISIFANRMLCGETPLVHGAGTDDRDYVFVGDVARANALAVDRGDGAMVNIGTGLGINVLYIFAELKKLIGYQGEVVHGPPRLGDVPSVRLNPALAEQILGWRPIVAFDEGMRRQVDWLRQRSG
jgi:UDP-glucose 4-epimerase